MSKIVKIKGKEGLVKVVSTGGVINTDDTAFRAAREAKRRALEKIKLDKEKDVYIESLEERINRLELLYENIRPND